MRNRILTAVHFYTYYSSPMDLLESIEDEILNTLEEDMIQFEKENSISQLMNSIIFYISEHKQLVRLLFSDHGDPGFQNKLLLATQHWTMPMWQSRRPDYDAEALSSLHIYIASGCMAVIRQWITGGSKSLRRKFHQCWRSCPLLLRLDFCKGNK